MRNLELEKEMLDISTEIWEILNKKKRLAMPKILSKQGGSSGCYYPDEHTVYYRWNVWNKLNLAGKRMLAIHELYHALGNNHKGKNMYLHAFDILTLELYKSIYGEDNHYKELVESIHKIINNLIQ